MPRKTSQNLRLACFAIIARKAIDGRVNSLEQHRDDAQIAAKMDLLIKRHKNRIPALNKPSFDGKLNITSLFAAISAEEHHALRLNWVQSVWNAWQSEHETISRLL